MVDTKMESRDQADVVRPSGMGIRKRMAKPIATEAARGTNLAPCIIATFTELCGKA